MLRSLSIAVLAPALAMSACNPPDLPRTDPTTPVVTAVFDPTTSSIPLPNDLVFLQPVNSVCASGDKASITPACAQADLLYGFSNYAPANLPPLAGAFPGDQEVSITIDFTQTNFGPDHKITQTAPDLDFTTFTSANFFVVRTTATGQIEVPLDPLTAADYVPSADGTKATLTIHNQGRKPWPEGQYALVMRGGLNGVQTKDKLPVNPSQVFDLLAQDVDLSDPKNLGLLKAQLGSTATAIAQGTQLNFVRLMYDQTAFPIADTKFPRHELAIATTFHIAPVVTNVVIDPATGQAPLPIDLLRDPRTGKLTALAACTLAGASLDASGNCPSPAAAGFVALDGFSTTGAILAPVGTGGLIRASSVTKDTLQLWDLSDKTNPVLVDPSTLIVEPCEFTSAAQADGSCTSPATALSPVIALQPAGASAGDPTSVFRTRPLKDSTDYAVVITTGVLDKAGNPLGSGSAAKLLKFYNPIVAGGHATVPGLDDATAASLEAMRSELKPLLDKLTSAGTDRAKVAIAYTFHTQTILSPAVQLAALPYIEPAATALPGPVTGPNAPQFDPAAEFTKFGVIPRATPTDATPGRTPLDHIDEIFETDITTFNLLDPATGAFNPDPTKAVPETIHVLIATPKAANPNVPACAGPLAAFGKCAPMMIFRHGLGGGRADMLLIADSYANAGMVTVAIDAAKHGDRSLCLSGAGPQSGCIGTCTAIPNSATQGDPSLPGPPGTCDAAGFVKDPVTSGATGNTDGIPKVSGNYLVSANFFRTRDTLRQDLIDESQLVRALAFVPGDPNVHHTVFEHMLAHATTTFGTGLIIDPATIYYSGQSLGAIQGTLDVATNPRISKAVLNVGGGTVVDVFTTAPKFKEQTKQILDGLGIQPGTPQFLQFLVVAKTVLDPADPVNFAGHLTANTLPNLLPPVGGAQDGHIPQTPKKILTQMAHCDDTVPNPFGFVWASTIPTGPLPPAMFAQGSTGTFQLFVGPAFNPADFGTAAECTPTTAVEHGFLLDFASPSLTLKAQSDAANFVMQDIHPLSVQQP